MGLVVSATQIKEVTIDVGRGLLSCYHNGGLYITNGYNVFNYDHFNGTYTQLFTRPSSSYTYIGLSSINGELFATRISATDVVIDRYTTTLERGYFTIPLTNSNNSSMVFGDDAIIFYRRDNKKTYLTKVNVTDKTYTDADITSTSEGFPVYNYQYDFYTLFNKVGNVSLGGYTHNSSGGYGSSSAYLFFINEALTQVEDSELFGSTKGNANFTGASGFVHNGDLYIVGVRPSGTSTFVNTIMYKWDSVNRDLVVVHDFGVSLQSSTTVVVGDTVYIFNSNRVVSFRLVDYDLTYTFKSTDGGKTYYELNGQNPVTDITVNYADGVVNVSLSEVGVSAPVTFYFEVDSVTNKQFSGLSLRENANRPQFGSGATVEYYTEINTAFYTTYATYRPPVETFIIEMYKNSAEVNRVDKSDYLTLVKTMSGVLRQECSMIHPSVMFESDTVPNFNYVYIAPFSRYYYVVSLTAVSKNVWRMELNCDVLYTYHNEILALTAVIARQENSFNPLLLDSELPAQANQNITVTEFPAGGFNTSSAVDYPFVLTVVGA